ncbi:glycoside hydrolase family 3 protein [Zopfochytrium polystomum]|nr:glycoside hydrolase family 3 protein [Zopfochytrium polystomum]
MAPRKSVALRDVLLTSSLACAFAVAAASDSSALPNQPLLDRRTDDPWAAAKTQAAAAVAQLTTEEKIRVMSGSGFGSGACVGQTFPVARAGIRAFCLQDGPTGVRVADGASAFSASINVAATFDKQLMKERGELIGAEFAGKGVDIALLPVNMARDPLGGRNWEAQGADPYLTALSVGYQIRGVQSQGVVTTVKHLVGNEQESWRHHTSSDIDDRTLREIYLRPFQYAVQKENAAAIMHSYNMINSTHTGENARLLTDIVKNEWGFDGFIVSDWSAVVNSTQAANAGLDMLMPGRSWTTLCSTCWGLNLLNDVQAGRVPEARINDAVTRILAAAYFVGLPTGSKSVHFLTDAKVNVQGNHRKHIRAAGAASTILAKNIRGTLPLTSATRSIAVIGSDATHGTAYTSGGVSSTGNLAQGGGSGPTRFPYLISPLAALSARAADGNFAIKHALNDSAPAAAASVAALCDVALVFVKSYATEGSDRASYALDAAGDALVLAVAAANKNTVVVLNVPGPTDMSAWADHDNVTAILFALYPGQESGNSLADVLFGDVNPSGRLPFTVARNPADYGVKTVTEFTFPNGTTVSVATYREANFDLLPYDQQPKVPYSEGLFFDYRRFDRDNTRPLYPFGHGLSYTSFAYANLKVTAASRHGVDVSVDVTNAGALPGPEVVQLYLGYPAAANEPVKQLKAFEKVNIKPGATASVSLHVDSFFLPVWDVAKQDWVVPAGEYTVYVGASSGDIRVTAKFSI